MDTFTAKTTNVTKQSWRCEISRCKGSASTPVSYINGGEVIEKQPHNHPPDSVRTEIASSLHQALNSASTSHLPPRRIISEMNISVEAQAMAPKRSNITLRLQRKRRRLGICSGAVDEGRNPDSRKI